MSTDTTYSDLVTMTIYPPDSGDYFLAKQAILRKLTDDLNSYKIVDTLFAYSLKNNDLIATQRSYETSRRNEAIIQAFRKNTGAGLKQSWQPVRYEGHSYLVRVERANPEQWVGAIVDVDEMLEPLQHLQFGNNWKPILLDREGTTFTRTNVSAGGLQTIRQELEKSSGSYTIIPAYRASCATARHRLGSACS